MAGIEPRILNGYFSEGSNDELDAFYVVLAKNKIGKPELCKLLADYWLRESQSSYELHNAELFFDNIYRCFKEVANAATSKRYKRPLQVTITFTATPASPPVQQDGKIDTSIESWAKLPWIEGSINCKAEVSRQSKEDYVYLPVFLQPEPLRSHLEILAQVMTQEAYDAREAQETNNKEWTREGTIRRYKEYTNKLAGILPKPIAAISLFELEQPPQRLCQWCLDPIPEERRDDAKYGSDYCERESIRFLHQLKNKIKKLAPLHHVIDKLLKVQEQKKKPGGLHKK